MKKGIYIIASIVVIAILMAGSFADAGMKDLEEVGDKGKEMNSIIEDFKTLHNTTCVKLKAIETATGVDLKTVTDVQVQAYFPITISAAHIALYKAAAVNGDIICEILDDKVPNLPATDN